ncbi:MAG TPA: hypothetical protein VGI03_12795 [Verrucomicrobiae bacterium]
MKMAWAILCSLLLAIAPSFSAPAPVTASVYAKQVQDCCPNSDCPMPCCAARAPVDPQPAPTAPAPSTGQNQLSLLAPALLILTLPAKPVAPLSSTVSTSSSVFGVPLFTRNCALLL